MAFHMRVVITVHLSFVSTAVFEVSTFLLPRRKLGTGASMAAEKLVVEL
jgi:hypothetical protein